MIARLLLSICMWGIFSVSAMAQVTRPSRDLIFAQVAAGGEYESQLTATNRGTQPYEGTLSFYQGAGTEWNPTVNDAPATGGKISVSIPAGGTATWKITGGATVESGMAAIVGSNPSLLGTIEGNLTYFVKSGETVLDGVGVMPSTEIFLSTIPFEDFLTVALALVNRDSQDREASVTLTVYSQDNTRIGDRQISIGKNGQYVRFIWQEFGRLTLGRGRLEIKSNVAIMGTALMYIQNQFSSLPLTSTVRTYRISKLIGDTTINDGQVVIWSEGPYFRAYFIIIKANGIDVVPPQEFDSGGLLISDSIKSAFYIPAGKFSDNRVVVFAESLGLFSFDLTQVNFHFVAVNPDNLETETGYFNMTMIQ